MEQCFDGSPAVCFGLHPLDSQKTVIGFMDGSIKYFDFDIKINSFSCTGTRKLKRAVRQVKYSSDGSLVYSISKNKALCVYDVQSNKRIRCIRESHDDIPYSMSLLPSSSVKGQQIATADESGEIRTWDMRSPQPIICTFHEQEEVINALETHGHMLLAASSDGTLGSYELRRRKLFLRSESMGNELLSIGITSEFTCVGNGDGYLDIFKVNEYGNLLERIKCNHSLGIDCMQVLRTNVILTASNEDDSLNLVHLNPNKKLGAVGNFYGGIQQLAISANKDWLVSLGFMKSKIKFWDLGQILSNVPIYRGHSSKLKMKYSEDIKSLNFFNGLCESLKADVDENETDLDIDINDSDQTSGEID